VSIVFVLVPLGLVLLAVAVAAFFWAVGAGQFDDLEGQGTLVLFDDAGRRGRRTTTQAGAPQAAATDGSAGPRIA
jgi:cbb3-type cytochrome oxidase maturation protein